MHSISKPRAESWQIQTADSPTQIGQILQDMGVADVSPEMTKWKRLYNALAEAQNKHQVGNHLIMFINRAMNPVGYARNKESFEWRRDEINVVLAFSGFVVRDDGKVARASKKYIGGRARSSRANQGIARGSECSFRGL